jgi:signal peptidase I
LGVRPADLIVYVALAAVGAMYLVTQPAVLIVLAACAVLLALAACAVGMRHDPEVSATTNLLKKLGYPFAVLVVLFFIGVRYVGYYRIPQNGMYPGLPAGSSLLSIRNPYRYASEVSRGDIVLFTHQQKGQSYTFIWRVVGLPGDTVRVVGDDVFINGEGLRREKVREAGGTVVFREANGGAEYEVAYPATQGKPPPNAEVKVPEGHFFVLGDNRHEALDSRYHGPIPFTEIIGKKW